MIAVCGIGRPSGRLNSATTAYQSARPPIVAASAKAAMKPKTGCTGSIHFAPMKTAKVTASTSVASSLTRRSSAARAASPGVSTTKLPGSVRVMMAFAPAKTLILRSRASGVSKDAGPPVASWFETRFALLTMRVQLLIYADGTQKEGPPKRAFQLDIDASAALSGGLAVNLGKVVLRVLRAVGDELADILGSRL